MPQQPSRRRRLRAETDAEIKALAWEAMREQGSAGLSLREVARRMGMAPSAMYRYFASRDDLLTALIVDAFASLGHEVTAGYESSTAAGLDPVEAFMAVAHCYRRWALSHRAEWALIFSTSLPSYNGTPETTAAAQGSFAVLQRLTADAVAAGVLDVERIEASMSDELRSGLERWSQMSGQQVPLGALAGSLWCYSLLHGVISLDLNGHLPPPMLDNGAFFDSALRTTLASLGPGPR
jgi:AcrR family transcriptional regulator